MDWLAAVAAAELREMAGHPPYLEQVAVYVDDPSERQGAATILLEFRFSVDDELSVRVVCLVDHGLSLKNGRSATTAEIRPRRRPPAPLPLAQSGDGH